MKHSIKYAVCPGWVISKNDGDRHFISAVRLMLLYNVHPKECVILWDKDLVRFTKRYANNDNLIYLHPDESGEYKIPEIRG